MDGEIDWAGYGFIPMGHHDGRFVRLPGLFGFVKRIGGQRVLLFVDHHEDIAGAAGPWHRRWDDALTLGMNELHVFLKPRDRIERLLVLDRIVQRCVPLLNLIEPQTPASEVCAMRA